MVYCSNCKEFFKDDKIAWVNEYTPKGCPRENCRGDAYRIGDNVINIIKILNKNDYPVSSATADLESICIIFDEEYDFKNLPKTFYAEGGCEANTIVSSEYIEFEDEMTQEQFSKKFADIEAWVNNLCNPTKISGKFCKSLRIIKRKCVKILTEKRKQREREERRKIIDYFCSSDYFG
jgi:hypothetical protein